MFFSEIKKIVGLDLSDVNKYNIVDLGGKFLYVDGIKRILCIGADCIVMEFCDSVVSMQGDFAVQLLENDSLVIKGSVFSLTREYKSRNKNAKRI